MWKWVLIGVTGMGVVALRRWIAGAVCTSKASMLNKTVVVTGANSGIGKAAAFELARRKARVILACRDVKSAEAVASEISSKYPDSSVCVKELDLASFKSIRHFSEEFLKTETKLDVLINNAGVYQCPYSLTEDGLELQMGVNHLGHFLLTNLLIEKIKSSAPSRIVIVSSGLSKYGSIDVDNLIAKEISYDPAKGYQNSKLAGNYFARELSRRLENSEVQVCCVRPGMARTNLGRHVMPHWLVKALLWPLAWLLVKSPHAACQTVIYCAVAPEIQGSKGCFYANCKEEEWEKISSDQDISRKLWMKSEELTGLR